MADKLPSELIDHFHRGNGLLFVGEGIDRDAQGRTLPDILRAHLLDRMN